MKKNWVFGFLLMAGSICSAAEIDMPRVSVQPGNTVSGNVVFSAQGAQITGIQFDLDVPAPLTFVATAAAAMTSANKTLSTSGTRIFVTGLNQTVIGDGALVALTFTAPAGTASSNYALKVSNVVATNATGGLVLLNTTDGNVTVGSPATLPTAGAFAHIASGGNWKTTFLVVNLSSTPTPVRLLFWDDNGNALSLPMRSPQTGGPPSGTASSLDWTIPASGSLVVDSEAPAAGPTLVGWAELQTAGSVTGYAIFSQQLDSNRTSAGVSPFENRNQTAYLLPFDQTQGFVMGVALANLSYTQSAAINVVVRDDAGNQIGTDSIALNAKAHTSYVLSGKLPNTKGLRGTLEFRTTSGGNIAVLGLRFDQYSTFISMTTVPR